MNSSQYSLSRFYRSIWLTAGVFVVFAVVFALYVGAEKQIDRANELRLQSYFLADELRQSSDDLTRMVRSYVITGDPIYQQHYQQILDIQDGKRPRPADYQDVYWDLVLANDQRPRPDSAQTVALLELMRNAGFSDAEFAKLAQSKANSDALTATEFAAMNLVAHTGSEAELTLKRARASQTLHDAAYQQSKASIMLPLREFRQMMEQRTLNAVHASEAVATLLRWVLVLLGLLLIFTLQRVYRSLHTTLGGSVDELHGRIARLASGDFSASTPVAPGQEGSVLGWLFETQMALSKLDAQRSEEQEKNRRLTQLYAALSQCNQAIVRCGSEAELFPQICRDAVRFGGMKMAWIGLLDAPSQRILPVASFGDSTEYLEGIRISVEANRPSGRGPTGTSFREDRPYWCQDFQQDPATTPWHEHAAQFGWKASASLPLHRNGVVIGSFTLYSDAVNAFDEAERSLLLEMVTDIDYALNGFALEAARKRSESDLTESRNLLQTIIDTAPLRVFWKDKDLRYLGCNPAFARDAGESSPMALIGKDDYQLAWKEQAALYRADDLSVMDSSVAKLFYDEPLTTPDGQTLWLRTSKVPLRNQASETIGLLGIYQDVTEQKKTEAHIQRLANYDALTGLPNRLLLNDRMVQAISAAQRHQTSLAVMFLDLDHFKDINDTLGHSVGDALLVEMANRLKAALREEDTVTRLGGDEFILLLPGDTGIGAAQVAEKLILAITQPYRTVGQELNVSASIGIAIYPEDGEDFETLSKNADTAMYRVKREGRNGYRFFTAEMQALSARKLQLENALRHALEKKQMTLHFQPQLALPGGRIIGAEALLRWQHPELGQVSPAEFIPIAEANGMILPIGEWVLRSAVQQLKTWMDSGMAPMVMAVNLSVAQFRHPALPELVSRILDQAQLAPEYLELELTEGVAMENPLGAITVMDKLHERGVRMSIDDFGTGYSSLSYLKRFKVYKLKIDQSFVRDISTDPEDKAIVSAVISLAKSLGLRTIAEGVETPGQLSFLREQGCDEVQGYFFSRPLPAEQFEAFVRGRVDL